MGVLRKAFKQDFTIMENHHLRSTTLSLKAIGLLSKMLSLPDDWEYSILGLTKICKDGKESIRTAILELENEGFLHRGQARTSQGYYNNVDYYIFQNPADNPYFSGNDNVSEIPDNTPQSENRITDDEAGFLPQSENRITVPEPQPDSPQPDYRISDNRRQLNTNQLNTKEYGGDDLTTHARKKAEEDVDTSDKNSIESTWLAVGRVMSHATYEPAKKRLLNAHRALFAEAVIAKDHERAARLSSLDFMQLAALVETMTKQGRKIVNPNLYAKTLIENSEASLFERHHLSEAADWHFKYNVK